MKKALLMLVVGFLLILSVSATGSKEATQEEKDTLVVAMPDAPIHLDPHVQASLASYRVSTQIFDRLVQLDGDMNLVPKLAVSWKVLDETTTLFNLRKGVKFHNGEEMKASDVKFSLERCIASNGVNYNYLIIKDIVIVDDYTIKIVTKEPFNALLYRLTLDAASIISEKAATDGTSFNANPVGAGPYKFVSWELGGDIVLEAFQDYYGGAPAIKRLVIKHIPEAINRAIGLETGELDMAYDLAITDLETIKKNPKLNLNVKAGLTVWYLGFNATKPIIRDVRVRKAIAYALNTQDIIDIVWSGVADPAFNTMLTPSLLGYAKDTVSYPTNLEKAKQLLTEAGYPNGFKTTLWCADGQLQRDAAVVIQDQLRKVGIESTVKSMEQGSFYAATGKGEHDLFFLSKTSIDSDSMLRAMYHTVSFGLSGNRSFWATPEIDSKLDQASVTTDTELAKNLYGEVQAIVADQLPLIPIAVPYLNVGTQKNVQGFKVYPGSSHSIYGTYFEK